MPPELAAQLAMVRRVVEAFGLTQLEVPGFEADDIIATLAKVARGRRHGRGDLLVGQGPDAALHRDGGVAVLDTMKNRRIGPAEVREKFGVGPEQVGDVLALMGDSIDNVPGVAGIGPKTAAELINKFGSLDALLAAARGRRSRASAGVAIVEARDAVRVSRELVRLREDVPLPKTAGRAAPGRSRQAAAARAVHGAGVLAPGRPAVGRRARRRSRRTPRARPRRAVAPCPRRSRRPRRRPGRHAILDARGAGGAGRARSGGGGGRARRAVRRAVGRARPISSGSASRSPPASAASTCRSATATWARPRCLPEARRWRCSAPLLGVAGRSPSTSTTPRRWRCCCVRRGPGAGAASRRTRCWRPTCSTRRARATTWTSSAAAEGIPASPARSSWMGTRRVGDARASDISVEEVGAAPGRRGGRGAGAGRAAAGEARRRRASTALYRDMELPLAHVLAHVECRGIQLDIDRLREIGHEVGTLAGRAGDGDPRARRRAVQHQLAQAAGRRPVRQAVAAGGPQDQDRPVDRRRHAGGAGRAAPGAGQDRRVPRALEAEGDVHRRAAGAGEPGDRAPAHLVQPGGRRDGAAVVQQPQPAEHPDPHARSGGASARRSSPSPGHVLVSADYSQIELRILAHFSQDPAFLDAFRSGEDIHQRTAAEVFGVPPAGGHRRAPAHRQGDQLRPGRTARATSAWRRCCASRAPRPARTSRATSSATPACARTWSAPSPRRARPPRR